MYNNGYLELLAWEEKMKKLIFLIATCFVSAHCLADVPTPQHKSPLLNNLSLAWKNQQSMHAKEDKNDITIVYGGEDVARKKPFYLHTMSV